jgi:hypothetical protein
MYGPLSLRYISGDTYVSEKEFERGFLVVVSYLSGHFISGGLNSIFAGWGGAYAPVLCGFPNPDVSVVTPHMREKRAL